MGLLSDSKLENLRDKLKGPSTASTIEPEDH